MGQTALLLSAAHSFSRKASFDDKGGNAGGAETRCLYVCEPGN
jgi:hypothetical protein